MYVYLPLKLNTSSECSFAAVLPNYHPSLNLYMIVTDVATQPVSLFIGSPFTFHLYSNGEDTEPYSYRVYLLAYKSWFMF